MGSQNERSMLAESNNARAAVGPSGHDTGNFSQTTADSHTGSSGNGATVWLVSLSETIARQSSIAKAIYSEHIRPVASQMWGVAVTNFGDASVHLGPVLLDKVMSLKVHMKAIIDGTIKLDQGSMLLFLVGALLFCCVCRLLRRCCCCLRCFMCCCFRREKNSGARFAQDQAVLRSPLQPSGPPFSGGSAAPKPPEVSRPTSGVTSIFSDQPMPTQHTAEASRMQVPPQGVVREPGNPVAVGSGSRAMQGIDSGPYQSPPMPLPPRGSPTLTPHSTPSPPHDSPPRFGGFPHPTEGNVQGATSRASTLPTGPMPSSRSTIASPQPAASANGRSPACAAAGRAPEAQVRSTSPRFASAAAALPSAVVRSMSPRFSASAAAPPKAPAIQSPATPGGFDGEDDLCEA